MALCGPVAQLDRALGFEPRCWGFKSLRGRHLFNWGEAHHVHVQFVGLDKSDAETPYYYGSLPAKPERGHILVVGETGNRYAVVGIDGEGLVGDGPAGQKELPWAEIGRGETVPTLLLQKLDAKETQAQGRSFSAEEMKEYSQKNRETRLSTPA
jgi:hypothetical protein